MLNRMRKRAETYFNIFLKDISLYLYVGKERESAAAAEEEEAEVYRQQRLLEGPWILRLRAPVSERKKTFQKKKTKNNSLAPNRVDVSRR